MLAAAEPLAYAPGGELVHPQLLETYRSRARGTARYAGEPEAFMANIRPHFDVMLAAIDAGRTELIQLHRKGQIEDEVLHDLECDLDLEELSVILQRGAEP